MRYRLLLQGARVYKRLRKRGKRLRLWIKIDSSDITVAVSKSFSPHPHPRRYITWKIIFLLFPCFSSFSNEKFHFSASQHLGRGIKSESREDCDWRSCAMFSFIIFIIIGPFGWVVFRHAKVAAFSWSKAKNKKLGIRSYLSCEGITFENEFFTGNLAHGIQVSAPAFI